ncbi:MAG TPA: type II 3-dehydroquinate dehydratase [Actinomycetota bacterium]|nr:type II 3-dehydroquinate dehydratase [Actinomycetota bacterium]
MSRILVLNGPNLDRLGMRQPEVYGTTTLAQIEARLRAQAAEHGHEITFVQSAREDDLLRAIGAGADGIIVNPAAFTHFSYALADALAASALPVVEVHLSNIHAREPYRRLSVVSPVARAVICGAGPAGYGYALDLLARILSES